jgi:hypothetical protein
VALAICLVAALVVGATTAAPAAKRLLVGEPNLSTGAVTSRVVRNHAVQREDLAPGLLRLHRGPKGDRGARGERGEPGPQGDRGPTGDAAAQLRTQTISDSRDVRPGERVTLNVSTTTMDSMVTGGGYAVSPGLQVEISAPVVSAPAPGNPNVPPIERAYPAPRTWRVTVYNPTTAAGSFTAFAVCTLQVP